MVSNGSRRERLLALNDPLLHPLIDASDESARHAALERILIDVAAPTIRKVLARYLRSGGSVQPADAEDITSTVTLRLVRKLQRTAGEEEHGIQSLADYVARQTFNAVNDLLRSRFPERMRLKHRLRYVLTHDPRLALWTSGARPAAGLARFRDTEPRDFAITTATRAMLDRERPADALFAILSRLGGAVPFEALIDKVAELWKITDQAPASSATLEIGDDQDNPHDQMEAREALRMLWSEVRELRAPQRAALLLNLRDAEGGNGIVQLLISNVATFDDVAAAVELTSARLAELWSDLPLDDNTIAGMLGLTRQQVINLRQAARDRLSRRMSRGSRRGRP